MDLPVFPLHTVLLPGGEMTLRVFEPRYLSLLDEVLPTGPFVVVAIRHGREVGGPADPYRVGVRVATVTAESDVDGSWTIAIRATDRVALVEPLVGPAFPRWRVEAFPDEGGAGTDDVQATVAALRAYLRATGETETPVVPRDPVAASWAIAAAVPGLVPVRQRLLEAPGAGERLRLASDLLRQETRLVRALRAGVGGPDTGVNPN